MQINNENLRFGDVWNEPKNLLIYDLGTFKKIMFLVFRFITETLRGWSGRYSTLAYPCGLSVTVALSMTSVYDICRSAAWLQSNENSVQIMTDFLDNSILTHLPR